MQNKQNKKRIKFLTLLKWFINCFFRLTGLKWAFVIRVWSYTHRTRTVFDNLLIGVTFYVGLNHSGQPLPCINIKLLLLQHFPHCSLSLNGRFNHSFNFNLLHSLIHFYFIFSYEWMIGVIHFTFQFTSFLLCFPFRLSILERFQIQHAAQSQRDFQPQACIMNRDQSERMLSLCSWFLQKYRFKNSL